MQLFLENFFASGLSILETEIIECQQLEEELREVQEELKQKETLLEQTQQELQHIQEQLIQLVAGVARQINNPTSFIKGNLPHLIQASEDLLHIINLYAKHYLQPVAEIQSAIEDVDLDFLRADLPKLLSSMEIAADRIREVIMPLQNFARSDEEKISTVNLHEGIDNTLLMLQWHLKIISSNFQVIRKYGELPMVECYCGQLNQVFLHLLNNAIYAIEETVNSEKQQEMSNPSETATHYSPTITIRTSVSVDSSHVIIQIADNGLGMTEEILSRLFYPPPLPKYGTFWVGLSLFISHQIVEEKHGGQLQCVSELGKGTEFTIKLPIRQQQQQPS